MTDIDLLADPFDTWQAFNESETAEEWALRKYGNMEDARWDIERDEIDCGD